MEIGLIYLIQPEELIGTKRYKIGCSKKSDLSRPKSYKKNSRYLCIMECKNPRMIEQKIKEIFNDKFSKIAGNEFFEGEEKVMKKEFINIYLEFIDNNSELENNIDEKSDNSSNESDSIIDENSDNSSNESDSIINEAIKKEFPKWEEDEKYGGTKKLLKICMEERNKIIIFKYIGDGDDDDDLIIEEEIIDLREKRYKCLQKYFQQLIKNNVIKKNKIYDLNDSAFLDKLDLYKEKFNITLSINTKKSKDEILKSIEVTKSNSVLTIINYCILTNLILNDEIYCYFTEEEESSNDSFIITIDYTFFKTYYFSVIKMHNNYYDRDYIIKNFPYLIEKNKNNNKYYILNRDYEYIGLNTKSNQDICNSINSEIDFENLINNLINNSAKIQKSNKEKKWERIYIHRNYQNPELDKKLFIDLCNNFNNLTKNMECLNMNEDTISLLNVVNFL